MRLPMFILSMDHMLLADLPYDQWKEKPCLMRLVICVLTTKNCLVAY